MSNKVCEKCGKLYCGPLTKFNNGNPIEVYLPDCDCAAEKVFNEWLERNEQRIKGT